MRYALQSAGVTDVAAESAGVFAMEGMNPTRETIRVLQEVGIDMTSHRARALTTDIAHQADLIFVMEQFQAEEVIRRMPSVADKVHLLKAYGLPPGEPIANPNIPDPIGKPMEVYEVCFGDIREAISRVAKSLGINAS